MPGWKFRMGGGSGPAPGTCQLLVWEALPSQPVRSAQLVPQPSSRACPSTPNPDALVPGGKQENSVSPRELGQHVSSCSQRFVSAGEPQTQAGTRWLGSWSPWLGSWSPSENRK